MNTKSDRFNLSLHLNEPNQFRFSADLIVTDNALPSTVLRLHTTRSKVVSPISLFFKGCTPEDVVDILDHAMRNLVRDVYGEDADITETYAVSEEA